MLYAITYSDDHYMRSSRLNLWTAKHIGKADIILRYGPCDLDIDFKEQNSKIILQKRGAGYWLWKPYIILKTLQIASFGDYIMYMDAGAFYVRSIRCLIRQLEVDQEDILLSSSLFPNRHWCKRDAFILMDCDKEEIANEHQVEAGYLLLKKTEVNIKFITEWLDYMCDERISTDCPNTQKKENYRGFRGNRHDQTVLSLLCRKHCIQPYKGLSDSSEITPFLINPKYFSAMGYSIDELEKFAYEEYNSPGYKNSKYKRIIVNCRARRQGIFPLAYYILKSLKIALLVDHYRDKNKQDIIDRYLNTECEDN